jgi:protein-S-isoprenylcysteine O-methyltransferase Ste14
VLRAAIRVGTVLDMAIGLATATTKPRGTMAGMETSPARGVARTMIVAAQVVGGGSLLAFGIFLYRGPMHVVDLVRTDAGALVVDTLLSIGFFVLHSGMVRRSVRERLSAVVPRHVYGAVYSIVSGFALIVVIVLWQPTQAVIVIIENPFRPILRGCFVAAVLSFVWGVRALRHFDGFGVRPIRARLRGEPVRELPLSIRGPYRLVRHPLYTMVLVMIWSSPDVTLDRMLFNVTWTVWIVLGTILEERDLIEQFGQDYLRYRETVPMLIPWRKPRS